MKNLIRLFTIIVFFSYTLSGCYYDKKNELYPDTGNCDTIDLITYTQSIDRIMVANCNICHNSANPSGDVNTSNYNGLSIVALDGRLWAVVNWEVNPMPKGLDKLSACDLTTIRKWVDAGSPNN
jgi:hypothetical protein